MMRENKHRACLYNSYKNNYRIGIAEKRFILADDPRTRMLQKTLLNAQKLVLRKRDENPNRVTIICQFRVGRAHGIISWYRQ
jgi:hypothetical protein